METITMQPITGFKNLQKGLQDTIKKRGINISRMCEALPFSRWTYYNRLRNQTFTAPELEQIFNYINSQARDENN